MLICLDFSGICYFYFMRITSLILIGFLFGCSSGAEDAETTYKSELKVLIPLKGRDPVNQNILGNDKLKARLIKLMGEDKYDTLVQVMHDCDPIGFNHDLIYWVGYGEHNPESDAGAVIIDLQHDEIYVGFEIGGKARIYSEAGNVDKRPNKLKLWLRRREKINPTSTVQQVDSTLDQQ
jgi:hypothetical protein